METFLLYIGKAALAAAAFYLLYLALFQHQKHFTFNRVYLPVSLALSFLIPLITFTSIRTIEATPVSYDGYAYLAESTVPVAVPVFQWQWYHSLISIYLAGSLGFLMYLVLGHLRAISIIRKSRLQNLFNVNVNVTFRDVHPFSFFNKIVLSEKTLKNPDLGMIVQHEEIHVRGKHTLDILFAEILFLFQWFNPFAWLLKDAIKNNLEYLTDHELTKTNDAQQYQLAMVGLAHKQGVAPFLTALNGSQLKNRIIMMKKKTENKYALLKQLVVLPLLAVLVMGLSNKEVKTEIVPSKTKMEIVVDGKTLSKEDPALKNVDLTKNIDGLEIMQALGIEDKVISNGMNIDEDGDLAVYFIHTSDYIPGTNPEFDQLISGYEGKSDKKEVAKTLNAIDGKIITNEQARNLDNKNFESVVILSGDEAVQKYGEVARGASVVDFKTGEPNVKVYSNNSVKELTVKGKITDQNGNPISGAAVLIDGTTVGTISDRQGNYQIKLDDADKTLIFVMVGFAKKEIAVNGQKEIAVQLTSDQPSETLDEPVFKLVDQMPEFPGGDAALRNYIAHSLVYPKIAMENGIQGKVYVTFVVNKLGKVVNPKIARGVDPSLDKEALRIVSSLPLWKPGKKDGENVNVSYTVPINFELTVDHIRKSSKLGMDGKMMESKSGETVSGKVTNESGEPLSGAAVIIKGTTIGTITDSNGMFLIGLNDKNDILIVSKSGYAVADIIPNPEKPVSVVLKTDQSKTGGVQIRKSDSNVNQSGNGVAIRMTGQSENEPLYIVDGIPVQDISNIDPENIEKINVVKGTQAAATYGSKGAEKGVIEITTKKTKVVENVQPLYVVDGKVVPEIESLNPEDIESVNVLVKESATKEYGDKGKNGVVVVTTKAMADLKKADPLLFLNGEKADKSIDDINPEEIESVSVFKGEEATKKYGEEGKNGVIEIQTKDDKITTEEQLRKYIARHIMYPKKAVEKGEEGIVQVFMEFGKGNNVMAVQSSSQLNADFVKGNKLASLHNYAQSDIINLDEVVVVAYGEKNAEKLKKNEAEVPDLALEFRRVLDMLPPVDIPAFKGKAVGISVKFELQVENGGNKINMYESKSSGNSKYDIQIPEGFSPNGDGIHDVFEVKGLEKEFPQFRMKIMNEKGETIWEYAHNGDPDSKPKWWDGKNKQNEIIKGTYFYLIAFSDGSEKGRRGTVVLAK